MSKNEKREKKDKARKEMEKRDVKREKDLENSEPATKRPRDDEDKRRVSLDIFSLCFPV